MTVPIYALTAIAVLAAGWAARGLSRALRDDLRQALQYAARRFRGLRIILRIGGRASEKRPRQLPEAAINNTRAPLRSTNGHRLQLLTTNHPLATTTKGGRP